MKELKIKVVPNAKKSEFVGEFIDEDGVEYWKVKVNAPAIENKANKELMKFLAEEFGVAKSKVEILSGEKSRYKRVKIEIIAN